MDEESDEEEQEAMLNENFGEFLLLSLHPLIPSLASFLPLSPPCSLSLQLLILLPSSIRTAELTMGVFDFSSSVSADGMKMRGAKPESNGSKLNKVVSQ